QKFHFRSLPHHHESDRRPDCQNDDSTNNRHRRGNRTLRWYFIDNRPLRSLRQRRKDSALHVNWSVPVSKLLGLTVDASPQFRSLLLVRGLQSLTRLPPIQPRLNRRRRRRSLSMNLLLRIWSRRRLVRHAYFSSSNA